MIDSVEILSQLDRVDWNLPGASTDRETVHSLHWFPGNFIPQIPAYLVQLLTDSGDLVVDPYCGSGTTSIEAAALGRNVWQSDIVRACVTVARGKAAFVLSEQSTVRSQLREIATGLVWDSVLRTNEGGKSGEGTDPRLHDWLHPDTHGQLRYLWSRVESHPDERMREILLTLFSDTLFACGSPGKATTRSGLKRRHHWGWIADNVRPTKLEPHNAIELFRSRLQHASQLPGRTVAGADITTRIENAESLSLDTGTADVVITSPPYLGMIDYTLANRLTYLWMGWSLDADRGVEVGARCRRNRKGASSDYMRSISRAAREIARVLKPGRYCALVIGNSRKFPDASIEVIGSYKECLELLWGPTPRVPTRRRVSERRGSEPTEYICLFRR